MLQLFREVAQPRLDFFPIVQGLLKRRNNEKSIRRAGQVFRHDDEAAVTALKQWRYQPLLLNGAPTGFIVTVTLVFKLQSFMQAPTP